MSWSNNNASPANSLNFFDSSSNRFNKIYDDSLSLGGHLFPQKQGTAFPFNFENTINFSQLQKALLKAEQFDPIAQLSQSNIIEIDSPNYLQEDNLDKVRKGLKDLASMLLQTFKHRKFCTQSEIVKCIQSHLFKRLQNKTYESKKILKNIKRRIYDAINVMISADLLERKTNEIALKPRPTAKAYSAKFEEQMIDISSRIQKKKDLLNRLHSKNNAIKNWIRHNKAHQQKGEDAKKLRFPLIFVLSKDQDPNLVYQQQMVILKNNGLQFFSQTDVLQNIYEYARRQPITLKKKLNKE